MKKLYHLLNVLYVPSHTIKAWKCSVKLALLNCSFHFHSIPASQYLSKFQPIFKWAEQNNMALHKSKFELLTYRTPRSKLLEELPSHLDGLNTTLSLARAQAILPSKTVKDLGVYLSHDLSWSVYLVSSS